MIERDTKGDFVRIRCDVCGGPAPSTDARIINHGLNGIGWNCTGGKHICPAPTCQPAAPVVGFVDEFIAIVDEAITDDAKGRP